MFHEFGPVYEQINRQVTRSINEGRVKDAFSQSGLLYGEAVESLLQSGKIGKNASGFFYEVCGPVLSTFLAWTNGLSAWAKKD